MILRQLFERDTYTFTYLLADEESREAVIIDPVYEMAGRDLALIEELGLKLLYCLDTHCHADHVTSAWVLRQKTGCKYGLAKANKAQYVDLELEDGHTVAFGKHEVKVLATPGHTNGCLSFAVGDMLFTGDCLFVRGCGRSDFQSGDPAQLYRSITEKLFTFPDHTTVYPGHDYNGRQSTTIGEERKYNSRIGGNANETDFVEYMENLNLPHPARIAEALPANLKSGKPKTETAPSWAPITTSYGGIPQIDPVWVAQNMEKLQIIDVRRPEEIEDSGTLSGATIIPLDLLSKGNRLNLDPKRDTVVVCRSGRRSGHAVSILMNEGFDHVANVKNGVLRWQELSLPLEKANS